MIVYIDTDAIVLETIDELFNLDVDFAAAPDVFPPGALRLSHNSP